MTAPVTPVPAILTIGAHNVYYVKLNLSRITAVPYREADRPLTLPIPSAISAA